MPGLNQDQPIPSKVLGAPTAQPPTPTQRLKPLSQINDNNPRLTRFIQEVNVDILSINRLFQHYNTQSSRAEQVAALQAIYRYKQKIDNKYSDAYISACSQYPTQMHHQLFQTLQKNAYVLVFHH